MLHHFDLSFAGEPAEPRPIPRYVRGAKPAEPRPSPRRRTSRQAAGPSPPLITAPSAGFSYDLDDLVIFYSGYRRLLAHWERAYPERILRVDYARMVESANEAVSEVLEFLGLPRHAAAAETAGQPGVVRWASAWQARQPVHQHSIERWRHYYEQAPEFFDRLAAIDAQYPSTPA